MKSSALLSSSSSSVEESDTALTEAAADIGSSRFGEHSLKVFGSLILAVKLHIEVYNRFVPLVL